MEFVSGNIFVRQMELSKAGSFVVGHKHNFDHTTYVCKGAVRVEELDDAGNVLRSTDKYASKPFNWALIKAGVVHRLTALEDDTIAHCIYAHRTAQDEIVQEYDGWGPAYV